MIIYYLAIVEKFQKIFTTAVIEKRNSWEYYNRACACKAFGAATTN